MFEKGQRPVRFGVFLFLVKTAENLLPDSGRWEKYFFVERPVNVENMFFIFDKFKSS